MPFVERSGIKIHYEVEGQGPPLTAVWGLGGSMVATWPLVGGVGSLPGRKVILVDPRGHGRSGRPRDPVAHRIEEYRDDILAVLDSVGVQRTALWGFSEGAAICCELSDAYPNRVSALLSQDGIGAADLSSEGVAKSRIESAQAIRKSGWAASVLEFFESEGVPRSSPVVQGFASEDTEMVALELEQWVTWNGPLSVLPRLKLPMLLIHSADTPSETMAQLARATGERAESHVVPDTNHFRVCCELNRSLPIVRDFLVRTES